MLSVLHALKRKHTNLLEKAIKSDGVSLNSLMPFLHRLTDTDSWIVPFILQRKDLNVDYLKAILSDKFEQENGEVIGRIMANDPRLEDTPQAFLYACEDLNEKKAEKLLFTGNTFSNKYPDSVVIDGLSYFLEQNRSFAVQVANRKQFPIDIARNIHVTLENRRLRLIEQFRSEYLLCLTSEPNATKLEIMYGELRSELPKPEEWFLVVLDQAVDAPGHFGLMHILETIMKEVDLNEKFTSDALVDRLELVIAYRRFQLFDIFISVFEIPRNRYVGILQSALRFGFDSGRIQIILKKNPGEDISSTLNNVDTYALDSIQNLVNHEYVDYDKAFRVARLFNIDLREKNKKHRVEFRRMLNTIEDLDTLFAFLANSTHEWKYEYALRWSCKHGKLAFVEHLLFAGPENHDSYCLRIAIQNGHDDVVHRLLQVPDVDPSSKNGQAVLLAAQNGNLPLIERFAQDHRLLNEFDLPIWQNAYAYALEYHHDHIVKFLDATFSSARIDDSDSFETDSTR
jgi:hypothetical protein